MLEGENVSFDAYFGFIVCWVCVKVTFGMLWLCDANYGYVCDIWEMKGYVDKVSFLDIYENYVKWCVLLRIMYQDIVKAF